MTLLDRATDAPTLPSALTAYIESERRRADVAGAAVAAFDRDRVRFAGGFGHADFARGERVTPDTIFRAASISKLFTTTLVLQEVEAGTISLDTGVNRYLSPGFRLRDRRGALAEDVTIRHLLTHTSGLSVSWRGLVYGPLPMRILINGVTPPRSLADVVRGMRTVRTPGTRIVYSNGAFSLLGYLAQQLNHEPFPVLIRSRVLEPLGMTRSAFPLDPSGPGIATPHGPVMRFGGAGRRPVSSIKNWTGPAGSLATTAIELAGFGRMVLRGGELEGQRVLSEGTLSEATSLQARNHPEMDEGLGLGFWVSAYRGRRLVGHTGGLAGVATRIDILPDDGLGVVVLSNGADASFVQRVGERVAETLIGLEPELVPGSPRGIPADLTDEWKAFTKRVVGKYRILDVAPPGPLGLIARAMFSVRLSHVADGLLALDGLGSEPAFLYPDGELGRYRLAFPLHNGGRVVIEEKADGTHLWGSVLHLFRPR